MTTFDRDATIYRTAQERAEARGGGYAGILHGSEILRALGGEA